VDAREMGERTMTKRETREAALQSLIGPCKDTYRKRAPLPDRYHGSRARMALIELHMREGRHTEAHAMVIAELDGTAG
jgi:hypothetical protein